MNQKTREQQQHQRRIFCGLNSLTALSHLLKTDRRKLLLLAKNPPVGLDRINKSVFLGAIKDSSLKILEQQLANLIQTKGDPQDSIIIIRVSKEDVRDMRIFGENQLDTEALIGEKSTLIL